MKPAETRPETPPASAAPVAETRREVPPAPPAPPVEPRRAVPSGAGLLAGGISIGNLQPQKAAAPVVVEAKPLLQEDLERYWNEAAASLRLEELLAAAKPQLGDHPGVIDIIATTTWFADEFKAHRTEVMQELRKASGHPMLDCKVTPMFVEDDEVVYSPVDKYNKMLERNPGMAGLRKLMPNIDY